MKLSMKISPKVLAIILCSFLALANILCFSYAENPRLGVATAAGFDDGRFLIFWNSRNARRKMSGSLIWWFKEFLDKVGGTYK